MLELFGATVLSPDAPKAGAPAPALKAAAVEVKDDLPF